MSRWVFDIECDGLLQDATRMWIMVMYNLDTREVRQFEEGDFGWKSIMNSASLLIGHNIIGYDLPVLKKLYDYDLPRTCSIHDTLLFSQILNYRRFGHDGHSLERWGEYFNVPKVQHEDWSQFSKDMAKRCRQDVKINAMAYVELAEEFSETIEKAPLVAIYLKAEHKAAEWCAKANLIGWDFDLEKALGLYDVLEKELAKTHKVLDSKLGMKSVAVDMCKGVVDVKEPKWTKIGFYHSHIANWFGIDPCSGYPGEERPIEGPYCRVDFKPLNLDSPADVKVFLFRNGWEPDEWNYKRKEDGTMRRTSPKITESSLEFLGPDGKLYVDFLSAKSRYGVLKTWIENVDENGKLHGECMLVGTPSMRARHSIIVNVPSTDSPYGKEMRELFTCPEGWKIIGCDSKSNQARGLAHHLGNQEYIDTLLNGDIHTYNSEKLTQVLADMGIEYEVERSQAKRILYAFLFGASGKKLWSYIFGTMDVTKGNKLKKGFLKAVPGFKDLIDKLENIFGKTRQYGDGYIPSLCGNRIYVDSFHKLLVYLLQSDEKITCSSAIMIAMEKLEEASIDYIPLIYYHDEIQFMTPEDQAEKAAEIGRKAFKDGPELFNVTIMDGDSKIGNNWCETH